MRWSSPVIFDLRSMAPADPQLKLRRNLGRCVNMPSEPYTSSISISTRHCAKPEGTQDDPRDRSASCLSRSILMIWRSPKKGGDPNSWMVYLFLFHGKSQKKRVDDNWGYPDDLGNFHVHKMCSKGNSRRPKKYRDWALGPWWPAVMLVAASTGYSNRLELRKVQWTQEPLPPLPPLPRRDRPLTWPPLTFSMR